MPRATDVFNILVQRMGADIEHMRQEAAELVKAGDYDGARKLLERTEAMEDLVREARALRERWQAVLEGRGFPIRSPSRPAGRRRERRAAPRGGGESKWITLAGYKLEVSEQRECVLPASSLFSEKFQRLARFARQEGELPEYWVEDEKGNLVPDRSRYGSKNSWQHSAYRHLEKALYRIARRQGLLP